MGPPSDNPLHVYTVIQGQRRWGVYPLDPLRSLPIVNYKLFSAYPSPRNIPSDPLKWPSDPLKIPNESSYC